MRGLAILNLLAPLRDGRRPRLPPNRISLECPTQPERGKTVVLLMKKPFCPVSERIFGICYRTWASLWGTGQDLRRGNTICPRPIRISHFGKGILIPRFSNSSKIARFILSVALALNSG